ncbi:MAG: MFS transporter [Vampirovibrionales bacterium]
MAQTHSKPVIHSLWTPPFKLLCSAVVAFFIGYHLLIPVLPLLLAQHHLPAPTIASILSIFTVASLACRPVAGYLTDRYSPWGVLSIAIGLFTLSHCLLLYWPTNTWFWLRLVQGIGFGLMYTSSSRWILLLIPPHRKAEGIGIFSNGMKLAMAIAPPLGLWLYQHPTWLWNTHHMLPIGVTLLFGMLALCAVLALPWLWPQSKPSQVSPPVPFTWSTLIHRPACISGILMATSSLVYGALIPFAPLIASALQVPHVNGFYTLYAITLMASRSLAGPWADRWGRLPIALPGMAMVSLSVLWFQHAHHTVTFLLATALYGLAAGTVQPALMADASDRAQPQEQGAALATFSMWNDAGIALGTFWMGWAGSLWGYVNALWGIALLAIIGVLAGAGIIWVEQRQPVGKTAGNTEGVSHGH